MSQVKVIFARALNGVMGHKNTLPWNVPADLKRFKKLTSGCVVVMGYNTWASLGFKGLPNRENIVVMDEHLDRPAATHGERFAFSLEQAINMATHSVWVIGGPALIAQAMRDFDAEVHRTTLGVEPVGDVFSHEADREVARSYTRVGYEEFNCNDSTCQVVFERLVKAGINAGLK